MHDMSWPGSYCLVSRAGVQVSRAHVPIHSHSSPRSRSSRTAQDDPSVPALHAGQRSSSSSNPLPAAPSPTGPTPSTPSRPRPRTPSSTRAAQSWPPRPIPAHPSLHVLPHGAVGVVDQRHKVSPRAHHIRLVARALRALAQCNTPPRPLGRRRQILNTLARACGY